MARQTTGFGTLIKVVTTSPAVTLELEETEVTPQGYQGNSPVEQTSMRNTKFRSFEPGDLIQKTDLQFTAYYDEDQLSDIKSIINVKGTITVTFKTGGTLVDTGWLVSAVPTGRSIGNRPTASFVVSFEGEDSSGTDNEAITPGA